ncbi:MAG: SCO family protein [Litoreibacter sp.]|nr:SCO family protein [Litoreibacter sp.]
MIRAVLLSCALTVVASASTASEPDTALPFKIGGAFELVDQHGSPRTQVDPDGQLQLLFFGYANCQQICSAALPLMAEVTDELAGDGITLHPVMITVDPKRDTSETIGSALREHHPDFVGLTGSERALQAAYDAFSVTREELFTDPEFGPVFSHGSFLYLLSGEGEVLTLLPPVLPTSEIRSIVTRYATGAAS